MPIQCLRHSIDPLGAAHVMLPPLPARGVLGCVAELVGPRGLHKQVDLLLGQLDLLEGGVREQLELERPDRHQLVELRRPVQEQPRQPDALRRDQLQLPPQVPHPVWPPRRPAAA